MSYTLVPAPRQRPLQGVGAFGAGLGTYSEGNYISEVAAVGKAALLGDSPALSIAGTAGIATISAVMSPGQAVDWMGVAAGGAKAISGALSAISATSEAIGIAVEALGAIAEAIPVLGQAVQIMSAIVGITKAADEADKQADYAKRAAIAQWCKSASWSPQGSGENGKVYPADIFATPKEGLDFHTKSFPPIPDGVSFQRLPLPMSTLGRALVFLLESPRFKLVPGRPVDSTNPWIGVSSERRRQWFKRTRLAIQNAPVGSDGGLSLWPVYVDLAVDEFTKRGATDDAGNPIILKYRDDLYEGGAAWTPSLAWEYLLFNGNTSYYGTGHPCDANKSVVDTVTQFCLNWINTYRSPKWAPGQAAAKKLFDGIEAQRKALLVKRPAQQDAKAKAIVAVQAPSSVPWGWLLFGAAAATAVAGTVYLRRHPEKRAAIRASASRLRTKAQVGGAKLKAKASSGVQAVRGRLHRGKRP